tara:strand:+ start:4377 stop:5063 length:687 start_codon:yes stop_codon:yes gene_type:complete
MKKKIKIFIFARKNSKGVKNKNLIKVNSKPLIYYSINVAKQIVNNNDIYISSDNVKLKKIAKSYGVNFIKRPKKLATSNSPEFLSWKHAINIIKNKKIEFDIFVSLPTTSPLRSKNDVLKTIKKLNKNSDIILTANKSVRSPYFNIVKKNQNGFYNTVIKKKIFRRQDAPLTFDLNTVAFVTTPEYISESNSMFDGNVSISQIPVERSLDIDTKFDLKIAKILMKNEK